ncbi:MAG: glycosyltransferase [candidate division WOR-3 bacterium]
MKIGIIHPYQRCKGGGERICCYLADYLMKKGFDVSIFSDQKELAYPEIFKDKKPKIVLPKIKSKFMNTSSFELYKHWIYPFLFNYSKTDILVDTMGSSLFHAKINKKVKIFYFHFPQTMKFLKPDAKFPQNIYYTIKDFFDRIPSKNKLKYACNSIYIKNLVKNFYNLDPVVIRPPVDTDFFKPKKNPSEDFVLLSGRIRRFKKFELALKYLKNEKVVLCGQINDFEYYNFLRKKFSFVEFKTNVTDFELRNYYQNCKCYIFTNWEEHFGIVPFEAMSCERKVIVPEFCGASELIKNGENGFLVKKDFSDFQTKFSEMINSDEKINKNARKTVLEHMSINVFGNKFYELMVDFI